jgi:ArsR family transcriptional regulator
MTTTTPAALADRRLTARDATRLASAFKALGDPARLRVLSLIGSHPDGEVCACELVAPLGLSQPTVSHHLKVLREAGLLEREKRGTWVYYRISDDRLNSLAALLSGGD